MRISTEGLRVSCERGCLVLASALLLGACLDPDTLVPPTVDEDASLPAFDTPGSRLHLQTIGDPENPPLIFLHGGPGTGDHRSLLRLAERYDGYSLSDDFFLVFYDQRGAGLSRRHGSLRDALRNEVSSLGPAKYLEDLEAVVDHFAADEPVFLFGHSWGGMHAMQYVNAHPDRVGGVVLSEPGSFNAEIENGLDLGITTVKLTDAAINDFAWEHQVFSPGDHASLDYMFTTGFLNLGGIDAYHFSNEDPLPLFRFGVVASLNDLGPDGMKADGTYTFDFSDNLDAFETKVLFINGSLNEILSPEFQREENMPLLSNTELVVLDDVGHDLMWVRAEDHVPLMRDYFNEVRDAE